ncbi:MAG TPA: AI-2E family transporter [Kofleriaceae bacterium]|nr:AI-2E family transporter [Kofleriaceae bacterium]
MKDSEIPAAWVLVLAIAACLLMAPFAGWIVLAVWLSGFARKLHGRIAHRLHGHVHLAAILTVSLMAMVLVPLGLVLTLLIMDAVALIAQLAKSDQFHSLLVSLVQHKEPSSDASIGELILMQGDRAWAILKLIVSSAAQIIIGFVILTAGIYAMLVDGGRWYTWLEDHAPFGRRAVRRLAEAFNETGRGLMFGIAGAGILQATVATAAFLVLGVPQAFALGLLVLIFSIVPLIGTALVWGPVAAGLAITGRLGPAIGLAIFGIAVIGTIDNLARPWLARWGKLQLPTFVVLVAMFGAVELVGGWGILFGPLVVRLAKEALEVRREAVQA